jgi:hypothetical protein
MARRNERRLIAADYEFRVHRLANTRTHRASFASDSAAFSTNFPHVVARRAKLPEFSCNARDENSPRPLASKIFFLKSLLPLPMNHRERVFMERLDDVKPTR